ncbi:MAG: T9SS type A sorting domain-containing protein [Bacteroidia bacterium]|nr:T9SS type A sorting domain-containing protein [Bacteroidia bacterium]
MKRNLMNIFSKPLLVMTLGLAGLMVLPGSVRAQGDRSVAREWNEVQLSAIRRDFARPTVQARNLFHTSLAMYDAWAAYDAVSTPFLLGRVVGGFYCPFEGVTPPADIEAARREAISYAAYRLIFHRYSSSPGAFQTQTECNALLRSLGYDPNFESTDYQTGSPAALGNYIAAQIIELGMNDGANEANKYANRYYEPVNDPLNPFYAGNANVHDPSRWQPIGLEVFIDQNGNVIPGSMPPFLSAEWGQVIPFALKPEDRTVYEREGFEYWVYHDPGLPPMLELDGSGTSADYIWGHSMVSIWSSHLDPTDGVMWDISPASLGNTPALPTTWVGVRDFYQYEEGGDNGTGHTINPYTGQPYAPQIVPRGDYTRVLAEFWADGPSSETPPGHWFTILNYVCDHPAFQKRYRGTGPALGALEWDVKAYFALGGAMHDAAITAWGIKGWYDTARPITAIRYMAAKGQSSDPSLPNYSPVGLPLVPGLIEVVQPGDPLAIANPARIGKIKIYAWLGHVNVPDPETTYAGAGWMMGEDWWPYQRQSFVTPPFAGYVSGHSTYSRAAAELMTEITGDPFFPGGMAEFHASKNEFLVFEDGPSVDVTLQWATYRDASDQTSLSRIWGSIHPPADDIPGRIAGREVGLDAFALADQYFTGRIPDLNPETLPLATPNPVSQTERLAIAYKAPPTAGRIEIIDTGGRTVLRQNFAAVPFLYQEVPVSDLAPGLYMVRISGNNWQQTDKIIIQP